MRHMTHLSSSSKKCLMGERSGTPDRFFQQGTEHFSVERGDCCVTQTEQSWVQEVHYGNK